MNHEEITDEELADEEKNLKPLKIHVSKIGSVRVDADEFFARPKVKRQIELMKNMKLVGEELTFNHSSSKKNA